MKIHQRQIFKTALTNKVPQDPKQKRLFSQQHLKDLFTLKADDGSVINGGTGVTQLGMLTKGEGVVHPEQMRRANGNDSDDAGEDKKTLEDVVKSKGLAGIFDHDYVDSSETNRKRSQSAREMESKARVVAREALRTLEASMQDSSRDQYEPTWTGNDGASGSSGRFGRGAHAAQGRRGTNFGSTIGIGIKSESSRSSKGLLAGLKSMDSEHSEEAEKYATLSKRIIAYIKQLLSGHRVGGGPSTDDILNFFHDVSNTEAAIFRRLLNGVAMNHKGALDFENIAQCYHR